MALSGLLKGLFIIVNMGLSFALEFRFYENDRHRLNVCPNIARMKWKNYNTKDAFLAGMKISLIYLLFGYFLNWEQAIIISLCNLVWTLLPNNKKDKKFFTRYFCLFCLNIVFIFINLLKNFSF